MRKYYGKDRSSLLCAASVGSMTIALKAKRYLSARGIEVNVRKLSTSSSSRGCIFGIEYPCELSGNILSLLRDAGIEVKL